MLLVCFEGIARLSRRVWRRFVRGSREISLVPSLHRASTDALIIMLLGPKISLQDKVCLVQQEYGITTLIPVANSGAHTRQHVVHSLSLICT